MNTIIQYWTWMEHAGGIDEDELCEAMIDMLSWRKRVAVFEFEDLLIREGY